MIRKEREVVGLDNVVAILKRCNTIRIAFGGGDPYVVPVSFGLRTENGGLCLYFHCAQRGLKVERIRSDPNVCFESDIFYKTEELPHGITARYESVIGFGKIEAAEGNEKIVGLKAICEHYGYCNYDTDNCKSLEKTAVYKINVTSVSGKRNLPADATP